MEGRQDGKIETRGREHMVDGAEDGCGGGIRAEVETQLKCLERASATAFSSPGIWRISLVNSEI